MPGLTELGRAGDFGLLEIVAGGGTLTFPRMASTSTSSRSPGQGTDTITQRGQGPHRVRALGRAQPGGDQTR